MSEPDPIDASRLSDEELGASVESSIREFLGKEGGDANAIAADEELWKRFDSLLMMELVIDLEERYGVEMKANTLKPDDLKTIARIRDVAVKVIRGTQA